MLRATERVFVTQSALSLQMKRLEDIVQVPLFRREGRRLMLTPAGEIPLGFAREILAANDRALTAVAGGALHGPARIGAGLRRDPAGRRAGAFLGDGPHPDGGRPT
jgi:DNA-binding transcriptional LysR family regulator